MKSFLQKAYFELGDHMKKHLFAFLLAVLFMLNTSFVWAINETGVDALTVSQLPTDELLEMLDETGELGFDDATFYTCLVELSERTSELDDTTLKNAILNPDAPLFYKYGMLELYLKKYDYSITDTAFITYLSSGLIHDNLKNLLINCISEELLLIPTTQTVLLNIYNGTNDETVAYRCLKTLAKANIEIALPLCISIYHNAENEMASKINAAVDIMASVYGSNSRTAVAPTMPALEDFLDRVRELYVDAESAEIRCSILDGLKSISNEAASVTAEELKALTPTTYASLAEGYAAYRDGVPFENASINWHGAIVASGLGTSGTYAQASGPSYTTGTVSYSSFLGNGDFMGYYQPTSLTTYTNSQKEAVMETADTLSRLRIPYTLLNCIVYTSIDADQEHYYPINISCIRCDGFVEYCFEINEIRVSGPTTGTAWDISRNTSAAQEAHSGATTITPQKQANNYMTLVNLW